MDEICTLLPAGSFEGRISSVGFAVDVGACVERRRRETAATPPDGHADGVAATWHRVHAIDAKGSHEDARRRIPTVFLFLIIGRGTTPPCAVMMALRASRSIHKLFVLK